MTANNNLEFFEDYLVLHLSGPALPPEQILAHMKRLLQLCRERNICKGIIHRSEPAKQKASIFDFYKLTEFLVSQQLAGYRFALVFPKEPGEDVIDFFQTASNNRGVQIQRFTSYEEAKNWLSK